MFFLNQVHLRVNEKDMPYKSDISTIGYKRHG